MDRRKNIYKFKLTTHLSEINDWFSIVRREIEKFNFPFIYIEHDINTIKC